jgi:putative addiction module component (TIGR02574 family)
VTIAEIKKLPLHEKLQLMEAIWEDLRANADAVLMPNWQKELLDARRKAVTEGRERVLDWDEVKDFLGGKRG